MRYLAVLCALGCATVGTHAQSYATTNVTLQDKVYFGSAWELLDKQVPGAPIPLGGGYGDQQTVRSSDGTMFAGIVDKRDANGRITDVLLTFTGSTGADAVQGEAILLGVPLDEAADAVALYQGLLDNPSYAGARIHVMGIRWAPVIPNMSAPMRSPPRARRRPTRGPISSASARPIGSNRRRSISGSMPARSTAISPAIPRRTIRCGSTACYRRGSTMCFLLMTARKSSRSIRSAHIRRPPI